MPPILFDTSIYITAMRAGDSATVSLRHLAGGEPVWLSAVVLAELFAGVTAGNRHAVERLERDFDRARRILVPNLNDWSQTGNVLALLGAKYGYEQIGKGRLTNDALIAMSAGRFGSHLTCISRCRRLLSPTRSRRLCLWRREPTILE